MTAAIWTSGGGAPEGQLRLKRHTEVAETHRWLDKWLGAATGDLRQLVDEIVRDVEEYEWTREEEPRRRRRRKVDQRNFETATEAIVANLAHATLVPSVSGRLAIQTGTQARGASRYDNRAFGPSPTRNLLFGLQQRGVLDWTTSTKRGEASSIAPTSAFQARLATLGLTLADFRRLEGEELIVLNRKTPKPWSTQREFASVKVDYRDTAESNALREEVRSLNASLAGADLQFLDDGLGPVDAHQRTLRRSFVLLDEDTQPRFDRCGRLFGGFWDNLQSGRRSSIRIEGEPVAVLDYASMFPRLAYAWAGEEPPGGDIYAVDGLEGHRAALKVAFNCLLFDTSVRRTWPEELRPDPHQPGASERLPPGWTVAALKQTIIRRHPVMRQCFGQGLGYHLMYKESVVLVGVLQELKARGIVALGLHDGLMAGRSHCDEAKRVMEEMVLSIAGFPIPVHEKHVLQGTVMRESDCAA